jgi:hypothetical protein
MLENQYDKKIPIWSERLIEVIFTLAQLFETCFSAKHFATMTAS